MKNKTYSLILASLMVAGTMLTACGQTETKTDTDTTSDTSTTVTDDVLNPNTPVSITLWDYYNGAQQAIVDQLVDEFNSSVGNEKGIYVQAYSQGSVSDLETAVAAAIDNEPGSDDLPDIFSAYADTAAYALEKDALVDLNNYFTEEELVKYVDSYVEEGYIANDDALYILPVAKSTELMMINTTDWEPFAQATSSTLDELSTVEGIIEVAQRYYEWTDAQTPDIADDGKAFYGRDSMANYFVLGMKQQGKEIFQVEGDEVTFNLDQDMIKRLWDNYYVPYVKGYFAAYGKFRSDDVKTGEILAYTGSTASSLYFPDQVETEDETYDIDYAVMEAPIMEGGEVVKAQQGAGMVVTKSDTAREYAASVFLKWFTEKEQNIRFAIESAYMPVLEESNNIETIDKVIADNNIEVNSKNYDSLAEVLSDFNEDDFYTTKNFKNAYSARKVLDYNLSDKAVADKEAIDAAVAEGASREEATAEYISDEAFEAWYTSFCDAIQEAYGQ